MQFIGAARVEASSSRAGRLAAKARGWRARPAVAPKIHQHAIDPVQRVPDIQADAGVCRCQLQASLGAGLHHGGGGVELLAHRQHHALKSLLAVAGMTWRPAFACQRQRILMLALDQVFEMQVRPGRGAGAYDGADQLALCHALAAAPANPAQVGVGGRFLLVMADADEVAVTGFSAGVFHLPSATARTAVPVGNGEVPAPRWSFAAGRDRMEAHAVMAADPRERRQRFRRRS